MKSDKILIISTPKKEDYEVGIFNYLKTLNFDVSLIKIDSLVVLEGREERVLHKGKDISERYDIIIPFISSKYDKFYNIVLDIFEKNGAKVFSTKRLIELSSNYGELIKEVRKRNINTFKTYISTNTKSISMILDDIEMPVLIKIPGEGKNIIVNRRESLSSILDTIESIKKYIIIKEIYHGVSYEEYLCVDGKLFGLLKKKDSYEKVNPTQHVRNMAERIMEFTNSKIFMLSILKDENGKAYFDDLYYSYSWQRFIEQYGNEISIAISKSIIRDKGFGGYANYLINLLKSKYIMYKIKKEII